MDEEPTPAVALKDVGGLHLGCDFAFTRGAFDVFRECHPRQISTELDMDVAQCEAHRHSIGEDLLPALHHRTPADQQSPSGVYTLDVRSTQPNLFHSRQRQALESPVKGRVGVEHSVTVCDA